MCSTIRIGIPKNTRNTDDSLGSGTKLLLPSWLLGFRHEKKETIFTMSIVPSKPTTRGASRRPQTGLASPSTENQLAPSKFKCQLTPFFQNHQKSQSIASGHDVIHIPNPIFCLGFLLWHLWLSHPPRARVNTCINVCTYPCTKPNGSQPN